MKHHSIRISSFNIYVCIYVKYIYVVCYCYMFLYSNNTKTTTRTKPFGCTSWYHRILKSIQLPSPVSKGQHRCTSVVGTVTLAVWRRGLRMATIWESTVSRVKNCVLCVLRLLFFFLQLVVLWPGRVHQRSKCIPTNISIWKTRGWSEVHWVMESITQDAF